MTVVLLHLNVGTHAIVVVEDAVILRTRTAVTTPSERRLTRPRGPSWLAPALRKNHPDTGLAKTLIRQSSSGWRLGRV
jgi:hypothetical protein